jgi:RNA polymerase sigma factor (sigma-70 family)
MGARFLDADTAAGGSRDRFPATPASAVWGVRSNDPVTRGRALTTLVRAYWKPVYKHIRLRFRKSNEEAKDLTQAFFARALERPLFESYDPSKARFRTYLRTCVDNFVANQEQARRRLKRGGTAVVLSLDFDEAERELELSGPPDSVEAHFDREWARGLHALAVIRMEAELTRNGKERYFEVFSRYSLVPDEERPSYATLADELGLKVTDVTNYLAAARRTYRRAVLATLREITASEEELLLEAELLGVDPAEVAGSAA